MYNNLNSIHPLLLSYFEYYFLIENSKKKKYFQNYYFEDIITVNFQPVSSNIPPVFYH